MAKKKINPAAQQPENDPSEVPKVLLDEEVEVVAKDPEDLATDLDDTEEEFSPDIEAEEVDLL